MPSAERARSGGQLRHCEIDVPLHVLQFAWQGRQTEATKVNPGPQLVQVVGVDWQDVQLASQSPHFFCDWSTTIRPAVLQESQTFEPLMVRRYFEVSMQLVQLLTFDAHSAHDDVHGSHTLPTRRYPGLQVRHCDGVEHPPT